MTRVTFKQSLKALARPVLRPLLFRLNRPIALLQPQIGQLDGRLGQFQLQISQLQQEGNRRQRTIDDLARVWLRVRNDISTIEEGVQKADELAVKVESSERRVQHLMELESRVERADARFHKVEQLLEKLEGIEKDATHLKDLVGRWRGVEELRSRLETAESRAFRIEDLTVRLQHVEERTSEVANPERLKVVADSTGPLRKELAARDAQVDNTLRFVLDRIEFVRREFLFELNYGVGRTVRTTGVSGEVVANVLNPTKVEQALQNGKFKINLGCGHIAMPDYVNVDARDVPGVDVVADVGSLPFEPGTVDEVFSSHLVEHFPQEELRRRLLPHWRGLLRSGGTLRAIVPDGEAMLKAVTEGAYAFEDFREVLFGSQDYGGDFHFNLLTPDSLTSLIHEAGFESIEIPVRGRRNGRCFEFEISARR
ncbi:methyltransferase domain-containing protein [Variovorax sp. J22R133]|uniref:methyltransferase domain-containing protein n=1 Tax=Variovorax brevis TaxID=3053503 RepID=UPI002575C9DC|nr:methyltransferase domain-containing protein [Variovorax sp. J22R133]MDM0114694.1 methyltransferase domain-containing protein [Variovorax sp. J22R133]